MLFVNFAVPEVLKVPYYTYFLDPYFSNIYYNLVFPEASGVALHDYSSK